MSYEKNKIISLLYRIFQAEEYHWANNSIPPTFDEISEMIENLEYSAYKFKEAESGRIRVEYDKESYIYTYYLNLGSV